MKCSRLLTRNLRAKRARRYGGLHRWVWVGVATINRASVRELLGRAEYVIPRPHTVTFDCDPADLLRLIARKERKMGIPFHQQPGRRPRWER